ncbi:ketopantoate reductase family protein [Enterococcus sp. 669A]|uniref:2-dehydropantoate 2-reductase n=1 Tax=Candidatus Enterococcus moelleringii TaxID=2815325 RepID=A0ABS3L7J0_9ENTE|nr:ketopantoate reductase family protein [Enterococcus sp. 669A]MBO1305586.1 ketopantoate reductase family protein [Enterococcus sp. 669A]
MKICFLGAGALGSSIGGTLAQNGKEVYLVDQWQEHVDQINQNGLIFVEDGMETAIPIQATSDPATLGKMDLVIVLVKSFATEIAIKNAAPLIGEETLVLSLQNGLGNEEILEQQLSPQQIIGGKAYVGGVLVAPGKVIPGIKGKEVCIGEMDGQQTPRIQKVADELNEGGITTKISSNIKGMIWDKLMINVATGALAGITGLPYGDLYQLPEVEATAFAAVEEAIAVAKAHQIVLSEESPKAIWQKASAGLPYGFKTSILQSLEKQQRSEIDFINGAVVRWGEKVNLPTPVNQTLTACVKGIEVKNGLGGAHD